MAATLGTLKTAFRGIGLVKVEQPSWVDWWLVYDRCVRHPLPHDLPCANALIEGGLYWCGPFLLIR